MRDTATCLTVPAPFNRSSCAAALTIMVLLLTACVTETTTTPTMKINEAAVISVADPNVTVAAGSSFAWLPEAVRFYDDERLDKAPIKALIESEIVKNIKDKGMVFVDSVTGSKYAIAYTAALESSLDDSAIVRRFGLSPGMTQVPQGDVEVEKGSLIVYVFDNRSGDIIWRSAAQVEVSFDMPIAQRKQRVVRVVAEMFQAFPTQQRQQDRSSTVQ